MASQAVRQHGTWAEIVRIFSDGRIEGERRLVNVPRQLLEPFCWQHVYSGRVQSAGVTFHLKEGEAALVGAERNGKVGQGERHLILGANVLLTHVLGKGRASDLRRLGVTLKCGYVAGL